MKLGDSLPDGCQKVLILNEARLILSVPSSYVRGHVLQRLCLGGERVLQLGDQPVLFEGLYLLQRLLGGKSARRVGRQRSREVLRGLGGRLEIFELRRLIRVAQELVVGVRREILLVRRGAVKLLYGLSVLGEEKGSVRYMPLSDVPILKIRQLLLLLALVDGREDLGRGRAG